MNLSLFFDYVRAEALIKKHSKTFYRAFSSLKDAKQRRGIYAVYAYCRLVDDAIDIDKDLKKLHVYKSNLDRLVKGEKARGFLWNVLMDTTTQFQYDERAFKPFYELIEGQEFDAAPVSIQTKDQLFHYCDLVASSVGRMLMPILVSNPTKEHDQFAEDLGRAFQITNICRDVGEDQKRDRIYLPKALMDEHGYTREQLWQQTNNDAFKAILNHLHHYARTLYTRAENQLHRFPPSVRFPLHASLVLYRAILDVIESHDYDVFSTKHFVPLATKKNLIQSILPVT